MSCICPSVYYVFRPASVAELHSLCDGSQYRGW